MIWLWKNGPLHHKSKLKRGAKCKDSKTLTMYFFDWTCHFRMCLPWRLNSLACACVICFLFFLWSVSASLFVGWPSHLFQSHICDLLGSDWYGNIIIQARILSFTLPKLSLCLLGLSHLIHHRPHFRPPFVSCCYSFSYHSLSLFKTDHSFPMFLQFIRLSLIWYMAGLFPQALRDPFGETIPCWALTSPTGRKIEASYNQLTSFHSRCTKLWLLQKWCELLVCWKAVSFLDCSQKAVRFLMTDAKCKMECRTNQMDLFW